MNTIPINRPRDPDPEAQLQETLASDTESAQRQQVQETLASDTESVQRRQLEKTLASDTESVQRQQFEKTLVADTESAQCQPVNLAFLEPLGKPGSLGRLGHYEVLEVLGCGGFGIVLKAFDETLHRVVAVKILAPEMAVTSPARKRFLREARSSAQVRHENVVQVYAIEETPLPYLVMEYIPGETLQQRMNSVGPLPADEAVQIAVQIARGLAAAHEMGLIHRDVKPANVLLEKGVERRVKLTDFGLARAADDASLTQSGVMAGTPLYMAPEQARGEPLDHRADLFSLGSVLYAMVGGRPPFRAANTMAVLKRVCEDTPRPLPDIVPEAPRWLCDVIAKLHAKDPAQRFSSAREVAEVLSNGLKDGGVNLATIRTTGAGTDQKAASPSPRKRKVRPAILWSVALFVGVLLLGVAYAAYEAGFKAPVRPKTTSKAPAVPSTIRTEGETTPKPVALASLSVADLLTSPDYEWGAPENLGAGVNTNGREATAVLTADECTLVFAQHGKLCVSRRRSIAEPFANVEPLPESINLQVRESPTMSGDGLLLVFTSARPDSSRERAWMSTRKSLDEPFGDPVCLSKPANSLPWEVSPVLSPDGLTLLLTTMPSGGLGKGDIVMFARKTRDALFGNGTPLPEPVNSPVFDIASWLSSDGSVLVGMRMEEKRRECRFYVRPSPGAPFGPPQSFGPSFDAADIGRPWLSPDGQRMYFHSRLVPGGYGDLDLWMTRRVPKQKA